MTEREAMPYEDLGAWFTDDLLPGWTRYWSEAPAAPPKPPWYRNSRVLLAMITAAAATLVVATALLVTLSSADFNQTRELRSINPAPIEPAIETAPIAAPPAPEAQAETEAEPPAAADPTASADAPPPPPAPRVVDSNNSDGPRMNVTRAPMSFTPGQIPAS
jgi:predicted lipid-binding transport protein (Tim44 family)